MAIRTYTVGDNSGVKRLDDLTGTWQSVPLNLQDNAGQNLDIILRDVMTDPLDPNKVFVCGERNASVGNPGMFWSNNGGVTWNKSTGDIANATIGTGYTGTIWELWVVDSNTIYATSDCGIVWKSIDGGITFNVTDAELNSVPTTTCYCEGTSRAIHFIDLLVGIVSFECASSNYLMTTLDGGATWSASADLFTIGGLVGTVRGVHLSLNQQTIHILTDAGLWVSFDGGTSYTQKSTYVLRHLSWIANDDNQLWAYGAQGGRLQTVDGGVNWTILQAAGTNAFDDRAGQHYTTTAPNDGFFSEDASIFSTSNSSLTGTLSEANQFPGGIEAVWTGVSSDTPNVIPGCTDATALNFNPLATADCAGVVGGVDYSCCTYEPGPIPEDPCECPIGYTYDPDTNLCELTETTVPDCLPTYPIRDGDAKLINGSRGTNFYPDVTVLPWPFTDIITLSNPNVYNLQDANLTPLINVQTVQSTLWGGFGPSQGRLGAIGIWANDTRPVNEWIGVTACIVVPTAGTYSIGFAGDERVRITVDGNPLVSLGLNGGDYSFSYWSVVELTLSAGSHNIEVEGYNGSGGGSFAAEIYSATVATLAAMTTQAELTPVTVWNTFDEFSSGMSLGENSGCSCPEGYSLSNCSGELVCTRTIIVPATPCNCYLATNCDDPSDTELITIDPVNATPLDVNATYTFAQFPDKCWTIEASDACGPNEVAPILLNTGRIDAADTLGIEGDTDYNWKTIQDPTGPITPIASVLPRQNWYSSWGILPDAKWITSSYPLHPAGVNPVYSYELEFNLPLGFVPNLTFDVFSDNAAKFYLNNNLIGDNTALSNPHSTQYTFGTNNATDFIPLVSGGPQTLRVDVTDNTGGSTITSTGFNLSGYVESEVIPEPSTLVTTVEVFENCDACLGICYILVDCKGVLPAIYTSDLLSGELAGYVGQVVKVASCPSECWQLDETDCPLDGTIAIDITEAFINCTTCAPEPIPVPFVNTNRTVKPGYDTKGCSPAYVAKISCDFSEAMFQIAASKRYGITFCCDFDPEKLSIKKQLMDLKMITDPDACKTIVNECCPPCSLTGDILVFNPVTCDPPNTLTGTLIETPVPTPNCVTITFNAPQDDNLYNVTGTDCCGADIVLSVSYAEPATACFDLNFPYVADPALRTMIGESCDCDLTPPFDCFCIQPYTAVTGGWISGTDCDGNLFNTAVYASSPGTTNPNPTICVRADGTLTTSDDVSFDNNGACDADNPCEPIVFDCECITPSIVGDDAVGFFRGTNCDGIPFDITLTGGMSYEPICVRSDGQATNSANVTLTSGGSCTVDGDCTPPVVEDCSFISYIGQVLDPGPGGGVVSGELCNGELFSYNLAGGQTTPFICVKPTSVVITGNVLVNGVSPAPCT